MMNNDSLRSFFLSIFVLFPASKYGYAARINLPLTYKIRVCVRSKKCEKVTFLHTKKCSITLLCCVTCSLNHENGISSKGDKEKLALKWNGNIWLFFYYYLQIDKILKSIKILHSNNNSNNINNIFFSFVSNFKH